MRRLLLTLLVALGLPAAAQDSERPAVLVADDLFITRDRELVAQGNVEAFQGTTRIRASAIRYNDETGALVIEGPIVLNDGDGTVILADAAELDQGLQNGLLRGARMVLNQQVQMAAVQIDRVEGRYSQLYKTAVTSCKTCNDGELPLWQIRARRVVHDTEAQQLYFDDATFQIRSVPVFYLPRLRLPDPTLDRADGFLAPSIRTTSLLGTGLKLSYFITLGESRDLTLTPYLSSSTRTLEFRYRQAFINGDIEFDGAYTRDDQLPDETRGYLFGEGSFELARGYKLSFTIEAVSDSSYFTEYGYSDDDRLRSDLTLSRARRDSFVRTSLYNFETLRPGELNSTLPTVVIDGEFERRFFPKAWGGELRFGLEAHSHWRSSDMDVIGRDVSRINGSLKYLRRFTHRSGLVTDAQVGTTFNFFDITQDDTFAQNHSDIAPFAAVGLSYPMARREAGGASQVLTPAVQLGWTDGSRLDIPNEESTRVEFDQGNILSLSRFPRPDRRERGTTAAVAVNWSRFDPNGWDTYVAVGQVFRSISDPAFTDTSGLSGVRSDVLLAGQIKNNAGLSLTARTLVDSNFDISKAELRGGWSFGKTTVEGTYVWLEADTAEDRTEAISEVSLDGSYDINKQWSASADVRYDVQNSTAATAGLGLTYNNECVSVDLSVRRRYTSSTSVEPSTDIGFNIGLRGFSASNGTERYERSCGK